MRQLRVEESKTGIIGIRQSHHRKRIICIPGILFKNRGLGQAKYLADDIVKFCANERVFLRFLEYHQVELDGVVTSGFDEVACITCGSCIVEQRLVGGNLG